MGLPAFLQNELNQRNAIADSAKSVADQYNNQLRALQSDYSRGENASGWDPAASILDTLRAKFTQLTSQVSGLDSDLSAKYSVYGNQYAEGTALVSIYDPTAGVDSMAPHFAPRPSTPTLTYVLTAAFLYYLFGRSLV